METKLITKTWKIDPTHSEIHFKVKHLMVSTVTGSFDEFKGTVKTERDDFQDAKISFATSVASINTKNAGRDEDLKSDHFFNAEKFPEITFVSTSFKSIKKESYKLHGNLTIRDKTKEIELDVEFNGVVTDSYGNLKAGFQLSGEINRKDFGLNYHAVTETGGLVVADKIKLEMNVQVVLS